jgi:hypothetical protein
MEEPAFGLILVVLAVLVIVGFAYDAYWKFIEWFARKVEREARGTRSYFSLVPGALDSLREVFAPARALMI